MKLGISTYTYTWAVGVPGKLPAQPLNVFDLLAKAEAAGVKYVQIADNLPLHLLSEPELDKLIQTAHQKNFCWRWVPAALHQKILKITLTSPRS